MDARRIEVAELLAGHLGGMLDDDVESSPSPLDAVEHDEFKQGLVDVCDACLALAAQEGERRTVTELAAEYLKSVRVGGVASQFDDGSFDLAIGRPDWVVRAVRNRSYPELALWRDRSEFGALYLIAAGLVTACATAYEIGPSEVVEQLSPRS